MSSRSTPMATPGFTTGFESGNDRKGKGKGDPQEELAPTAQSIINSYSNQIEELEEEPAHELSDPPSDENGSESSPKEEEIRFIHNLERAAMELQSGGEPTSLPFRLSSIRIQGSQKVRPSFLSSLCSPYIDPTLNSSPFSLFYSTHRLNFTTPSGYPSSISSLLNLATSLGTDLTKFDLFSDITAKLEASNDPLATEEDVDVVIDVKEKSRMFLKSSTDVGNGEGSASVNGRVRNLFGGAESLEGSCTFGTRTKRALHLVLSSPLFSSPDHSISLSGFTSDKDCTGFASSYERTQGGKLSLISNFISNSQHEISYEAAYRYLNRFLPDASISIRKLGKPSTKTSLSHSWSFDNRDDPICGTSGYLTRIKSELASSNLGGDTSFLKSEFESQISRGFGKGFAWSLATRVGFIQSLDSRPIPWSDRFQLGGPTDVRMFRMNGIGPKDYGDSLGGDAFWAIGASLFSPIPYKEHWPLKIHSFLNAGQLTQFDQTKSSSFTSLLQPSSSAGVGLLYRQGALRIELNAGLPLTARAGDSTRKGLQLGLGISFL